MVGRHLHLKFKDRQHSHHDLWLDATARTVACRYQPCSCDNVFTRHTIDTTRRSAKLPSTPHLDGIEYALPLTIQLFQCFCLILHFHSFFPLFSYLLGPSHQLCFLQRALHFPRSHLIILVVKQYRRIMPTHSIPNYLGRGGIVCTTRIHQFQLSNTTQSTNQHTSSHQCKRADRGVLQSLR